MSPSDTAAEQASQHQANQQGNAPAEVGTLAERLCATTDAVVGQGRAHEVNEQELRRLVSAAVRLYSAHVEATDQETTPLEEDVATTDAVVMACALLRAEELNPFDLALWFSRSGR